MSDKDPSKDPRLTYIDTDPATGLAVYVYHPTLFRPLYTDLHRNRFMRRLRFAYEYLHKGHYTVYYAVLGDTVIGYNCIAPGGRRLAGTTPRDAVTGPSYILPAYRNRGYNKGMKRVAYPHCGFKEIYCWVKKTNKASAASLTKYGFIPCGEVTEKPGLLKKLVPAEDGTAIVFKYICP